MASQTTGAPTVNVADILCPQCHRPNLRRAKRCQHCGADILLNNDGPRRYKITGIIKRGGQGAVYRAIEVDAAGQPIGQRLFAVKEMLDRFVDPKERAEAITRFNSEAELLQHLQHPRIPRVYSHFKDDGRNYLVMDFIRGEDMEQVLQREHALPEQSVLDLAEQLCDVLDYLHRKQFIYRDMKPSNIMIDYENGGIKLVDFGIAKLFKPAERGTQIGTPGYAPPEQYQGIATPESDIYALGATLHHMLTGRDPRDEKPFSFPPVRELKPEVSQRTADAIARALQWKADDRYRSVQAFWRDLRPQPAPEPPAQPAAPRPAPQTVALPQPQPSVAAARPAAAPPQPRAAQPAVPPAKPRRGGFLRRLWRFLVGTVVLLALLTATAGVLAWQFPAAVPPVTQLVEQVVPGLVRAAPQPPATPQFISREVTASVPAGADATTIRQKLAEAFVAQIQSEYGARVKVNSGTLSTVGDIQKVVDNADGTATYRATVQALVMP